MLGATIAIITTHIRSAASSERAQRVRYNSNRLNYFLQVEAGEAVSIATAQTSSSQCAGAPASLFTLNIPLPSGTLAAISTTGNTQLTTTPIHYYISGGNLTRCGPTINRNGSLNLTPPSGSNSITYQEGVISSGTTLTLTTCQGVFTTSRALVYQASFSEATASGSASYQPPCEIARAKSFFVVDPP